MPAAGAGPCRMRCDSIVFQESAGRTRIGVQSLPNAPHAAQDGRGFGGLLSLDTGRQSYEWRHVPHDYDSRDHFAVLDDALKHPNGRARGGEPCVQCGVPLATSAHWKHRDRHVCSTRCNTNLVRKFHRGSSSIAAQRKEAVEKVVAVPNPRLSSEPRVFRSRPRESPPIEWEGYGPRPGDVIERYGIVTTYHHLDVESPLYTGRMLVAVAGDGERHLSGTTSDGFASRFYIGQITAAGMLIVGRRETFLVGGVECKWEFEIVNDLHHDDVRHFT